MATQLDWNDFKFVHAVVRTGSVRAAGELLRVHGSTVARHIDRLEDRMGTRLFARTSRGMEMTASAAEVVGMLDRAATELERVERELFLRRPGEDAPVTLAAPATLLGDLVIPWLPAFARQHPDVAIALTAAPALERLALGEAELALAVTDDPPEDLVGRPLGPLMVCAYAAPDCLAALASGAAVRWIGGGDPAGPAAVLRTRHFAELGPGLELEDPGLRAAALEAGLGIGVLPCHLGDPRSGLRRAVPAEPVRAGEVWLFSRAESRGVTRIQTVSGFLQERFARHRARLEGGTAAAGDASS